MRSIFLTLLVITLTPFLKAQDESALSGWIVDDFNSEELQSAWTSVSGNWTVSSEHAVPKGSAEQFALFHSLYVMRTKPYLIDGSVKGIGGGFMFCMEDAKKLAMGHAVMITGNSISTGYFDFAGKYVETRVVDYIAPRSDVRIRVYVDPVKRIYSVKIQDRDVATEELRFVSGYAGLYSKSAGVQFDYFQLLGEGQPETPAFYVKSNHRQVDHLAYMTMYDESVMISNPVIGIVQRITSTGTFVNEIPIQGVNSVPRGVFVDNEKWIYVVDGGQKAIRVYNSYNQLERTIATDLTDPRGVAFVDGTIYVLDVDGIKLFDKQGNLKGTKAVGLFKDAKNMFFFNDKFLVADFGNGQVQILDKASLSVVSTIKEQLVNPWDVCVDAKTNDIYVADPGTNAVLHYNSTGGFEERIDPITIRGFISPRAVRVQNNMIYVADYERILGFKKGVLSIRPTMRID